MLKAPSKFDGLTVERVKTALGLLANIKNLRLETLGMKTDHGYIFNDVIEAAPMLRPLRHW